MRTRTDYVVIHRAEVDFGAYHFLVQRDGTIASQVPFLEKAPHAKDWNDRSIGIAVFGDFARDEPGRNHVPTDAQYAGVADLIYQLDWWYGRQVPLIGHSALGPSGTAFAEKLQDGHTCPGELWDWNRLDACIQNLRRTRP